MARPDCPICNSMLREPPTGAETVQYHCPRGGTFRMTRTAEAVVRAAMDVGEIGRSLRAPTKVAAFVHALRKMQYEGQIPLVNSDTAKQMLESATLPTPQEQADNLLRLVADNTPPGEYMKLTSEESGGIIGTQSAEGWTFVVKGLAAANLATYQDIPEHGVATVMLTFQGWARYEELKRGAPSGRRAFMAMQYSDPVLDRREGALPSSSRPDRIHATTP